MAIVELVPCQDCLLDFLKLIGDEDRHVRKAAVVALSAVAHHKPELVAVHLPALLPLLYDQTVTKPELVRTVDLGPFKHKVSVVGLHYVLNYISSKPALTCGLLPDPVLQCTKFHVQGTDFHVRTFFIPCLRNVTGCSIDTSNDLTPLTFSMPGCLHK